MTGQPEGAPKALGDSGRSSSPGNPVTGRRQLATELDNLAEELTATSRRLKRAWPKGIQVVATVWRPGLEEVRGYIDRVVRMQADCQATIAEEAKASGEEGTAPEALTQLDEAINEAFGVTLAALHSLEVRDELWVPDARQKYYRAAADQLAELAPRCSGLAVHMRGPEGLEEDSGPGSPEEGSGPEGLEEPPAS